MQTLEAAPALQVTNIGEGDAVEKKTAQYLSTWRQDFHSLQSNLLKGEWGDSSKGWSTVCLLCMLEAQVWSLVLHGSLSILRCC